MIVNRVKFCRLPGLLGTDRLELVNGFASCAQSSMCYAWHIGMHSTSAVWAVQQGKSGSLSRFCGWLVKNTELLALISALAGHIDLAICRDVLCGYQFYSELADHAEPCSATVPSQHWAAEKLT